MNNCLASGGLAGEMLRVVDWSSNPLGPVERWPLSLQSAVRIVLSSEFPMMLHWGPDLITIYNDAYALILGRKHSGNLGRPAKEGWSETWDQLEPIFEKVRSGSSLYVEDAHYFPDRDDESQEAFFTHCHSPLWDDEGRIAGVFLVVTETTAHVLAERRSTAERERLFEMSRDLFGVATFDGYLQTINPAWSRILDRSDEELLARPFSEIIHPDDLATTGDVVAALSRGEPVHQFHVRLLKSNGEPVSFAWSAVPEGSARAGTFYTVGRDITEELRREEMLRQSQKMEAVGQLTGGLAHDFNNILAGISGSLEMAQARITQGRVADIDRYLMAAQGASKRAAALTHRLLAFSRRQTLDPKPTAINALIIGMEELIRRTVGPAIAVESVAAGGVWNILVDPNQLENALLNLCINARDAMPDGGRITIETANRWLDDRAARERDLPPGQYVSMCVSDNGIGMTPDIVEKAFDPFFTTKPIGIGTGLGLSMIYGFARQSGGQVRIYSEVGQGTMVCVYLPRHLGDEDAAIVKPDASAAGHVEASKTVLVIDDEPLVRMLVVDVLEDLSYTAVEAGDGPQGLKVLRSDARIDLLITDVGLPNGMNGRQVADAARELQPDLKVLFITGYAENAVLNHGHLEHGMSVMTKPFVLEDLGRKIRSLFND